MAIQWYPGHMHKAAREIESTLPEVDLFLEILDARIPYSSQNPLLETLCGDKPALRILNKADLADPEQTDLWCANLSQQDNRRCISSSREDREQIQSLPGALLKMAPYRKDDRQLSVLISGIPNVGKSTMLNTLVGRSLARTGNEPAITRAIQRVRLDPELILFDTPGLLWPRIEHPSSGFRLAVTGAVRETAMDYIESALFLSAFLIESHSETARERYNFSSSETSPERFLERVGRERGTLGKGGGVDMERAARALIADYRSGALGRITLETPEDMVRERIEAEAMNAERERKKAERKQRKRNSKTRQGNQT